MAHGSGRPREDLVGRVHRLSDLVEYSPGSIVSRAIIDRGKGTLTAFAFDEGEGLSEHTAPFDAFVHIVEGHLRIDVGGERHDVQDGEVLIMPADLPHALKAVERSKMLLTMIRE